MSNEGIGGVVMFSPINHVDWRIRHDAVLDDMVFETARKVSGARSSRRRGRFRLR